MLILDANIEPAETKSENCYFVVKRSTNLKNSTIELTLNVVAIVYFSTISTNRQLL
jgi:hypothetical protein